MAVCNGCGATYQDGLYLCPYCAVPQRTVSTQAGTGTGRGLRCPVCGQMDMVRKVSALYEASERAGNFSQSDQATIISQLAPPPEPGAPSAPPPGRRQLIISSLIGLLAGALLAFFITMIGLNTVDNGLFVFGICAAGAVLAFVGCSALFDARYRRALEVKQAAYDTAYAQYAYAFDCWQSLYHCRRDGIVYLPDTDQCVPMAQALLFCYRHSQGPGD